MYAAEDAPDPLIESLAQSEDSGYANVLNGIRETTAAVDQAFTSPSPPDGAVLDELVALGAHERRLRELGAPDLRAAETHDTLLAELVAFQDELLLARAEARADLPRVARIVGLTNELSPYA